MPVEKLICATPELKKADAAMSAAYFKLLQETTAPEFREAMIRSQRRWLAVRSRGLERFGAAENEATDDHEALLIMTRDRLTFFETATPIRAMEQQRKITSKDSGGSFAGFNTSSCFFLPPPYGNWTYTCMGAAHRQHGDRVCSVATDWASGHMTDYRLVSILRNGVPKRIASCSTGYAQSSEICPDTDNDAETAARAHWNTNPQPNEGLSPSRAGDLWKYDPELSSTLDDQSWMQDCLFAPTYPPPDTIRPSQPATK